MIRRRKQYKYVIDITSIEHKFEIIRTISKSFTFKTHVKMLAKAGPSGDPIATPSFCLCLLLKKDSLGPMLKANY